MSRIDVLRPFIEKNLAAMLETERVAPDGDGEYTFPRGSAEITLRLLEAPDAAAAVLRGARVGHEEEGAGARGDQRRECRRAGRSASSASRTSSSPHGKCRPTRSTPASSPTPAAASPMPPTASTRSGQEARRQDGARRHGRGGGGCLGARARACWPGSAAEIADLTGQVLRATVAVSGSTSDGGSSGSGFFIDTRGHIVTNHHVIADVQPPITITLHGGAKAMAGVVGVDQIADIAVLTLDGKWPHALPLRRSRVRTGEMCLAVGNPLGRYPESVTIGVVSGLARTASAGPGPAALSTCCRPTATSTRATRAGRWSTWTGASSASPRCSTPSRRYIGLAIPAETVRAIVPQLLGARDGWSAPRWASRWPSAAVTVAGQRGHRPRGGAPAAAARPGAEGRRRHRERGDQPVPDPPALFALLGGDRIGRATPDRRGSRGAARLGDCHALAAGALTSMKTTCRRTRGLAGVCRRGVGPA